MGLRPPQHRADAPGRYIHGTDDAWDNERLERDKADGKLTDQHPVVRYLSGRTRYDLEAEGVREYLRPGVKPVVFVLRRLSHQEYIDCLDIEGTHARLSKAAMLGVLRVEGAMACSKLGREELEQLHEANRNIPVDLGLAVMNYGRPPDAAEGKPSGSGGGATSPAEPAKDDGSR
jgi:hypothetical protein